MHMRPSISVLINNHNYGRFVARAIASALAQKEQEAEIVIVDDGSTDQSREVLQGYRDKVKIVLQNNRGQAAAINAGVRVSEGEYLCFLDADDWWAPGKLAAISAVFRSHKKAALVYHRLQPVLADEAPTQKPIPRTLCDGDLSRRLIKSAGWWPFPMTSAIAVRRSAWEKVGDIPEEFRISADAWLAGMYPFVGDVAALPHPLGFYRIHSNNWYRPVDDTAMLRKRMAHWHATVEATNRFLAAHGLPRRLRLRDHHPYRVAAAKLEGAGLRSRFELLLHGILFQGEPNFLRRTRDAMRAVRDIPSAGSDTSLSEAAK
jgi:glycosyltransferase involved in cell wall biosynthesis